jgi:hypothetical protein
MAMMLLTVIYHIDPYHCEQNQHDTLKSEEEEEEELTQTYLQGRNGNCVGGGG